MILAFQHEKSGNMYLVGDNTHTEIHRDGSYHTYEFYGKTREGRAMDRVEALDLLKNTISVSVEHVQAVWRTRART